MNAFNKKSGYFALSNLVRSNVLITVIAFLFIFVYGKGGTAYSATIEEPHSMECCHLTKVTTPGSTITIELESPGATGAEWFIDTPPHTTLISQGRRPSNHPAGLVGAPVMQWWKLHIGHPKVDTVAIHFFLYRRWEGKDKAFKQCVVDVILQ